MVKLNSTFLYDKRHDVDYNAKVKLLKKMQKKTKVREIQTIEYKFMNGVWTASGVVPAYTKNKSQNIYS